MTSSKHQKSKRVLADDERDDPGIGESKGMFMTGKDPEDIEGASTVEGDILSDSSVGGGVDPEQLGRTNK